MGCNIYNIFILYISIYTISYEQQSSITINPQDWYTIILDTEQDIATSMNIHCKQRQAHYLALSRYLLASYLSRQSSQLLSHPIPFFSPSTSWC